MASPSRGAPGCGAVSWKDRQDMGSVPTWEQACGADCELGQSLSLSPVFIYERGARSLTGWEQ